MAGTNQEKLALRLSSVAHMAVALEGVLKQRGEFGYQSSKLIVQPRDMSDYHKPRTMARVGTIAFPLKASSGTVADLAS